MMYYVLTPLIVLVLFKRIKNLIKFIKKGDNKSIIVEFFLLLLTFLVIFFLIYILEYKLT